MVKFQFRLLNYWLTTKMTDHPVSLEDLAIVHVFVSIFDHLGSSFPSPGGLITPRFLWILFSATTRRSRAGLGMGVLPLPNFLDNAIAVGLIVESRTQARTLARNRTARVFTHIFSHVLASRFPVSYIVRQLEAPRRLADEGCGVVECSRLRACLCLFLRSMPRNTF